MNEKDKKVNQGNESPETEQPSDPNGEPVVVVEETKLQKFLGKAKAAVKKASIPLALVAGVVTGVIISNAKTAIESSCDEDETDDEETEDEGNETENDPYDPGF